MHVGGMFNRLNRWDNRLFRAAARSDPTLLRFLPRLSRAADFARLWILIATALTAWGGRSGQRAALRGLGSLAVTSILVNLFLKPLFRRTRPPLSHVPALRQLKRQPRSASLPSGHAASAAAFSTGVALELPALAPLIVALAAAVAYSRIYTGVHYPSDVAAGAAVGTSVALLSRVLWPRIREAPPLIGESARASIAETSGEQRGSV
jgi:membrane-associated phospholipid phosphatase